MYILRLYATYTLLFVKCIHSLNCDLFLNNNEISQPSWKMIEKCLISFGNKSLDESTGGNIWRQIKDSNDGADNVPLQAYKNMGKILTFIPVGDLQNITFDQLEIVQAFGKISDGFSDQQKNVIVQKVRTEWSNKSPEKYSEYDLVSLGQIICYLNKSDIAAIHPDAFKGAIERIGNLRNCPVEKTQALAKLAIQPEAFDSPSKWTKIVISRIGNIISGLDQDELNLINPEFIKSNKWANSAVYSRIIKQEKNI